MVTIFVAEEDIRIKTPHKVLTRVSNGNIDELMCEVLKKCNDANVEIVSWSNRYKFIQDNPRNAVEKEISSILNKKGVVHRKFTTAEWNDMKGTIKERIYVDAVKAQKMKMEITSDLADDPFA